MRDRAGGGILPASVDRVVSITSGRETARPLDGFDIRAPAHSSGGAHGARKGGAHRLWVGHVRKRSAPPAFLRWGTLKKEVPHLPTMCPTS
jgi:hypothetical protein